MPRAIILMLDSLGVGAAPDAEQFGDQSADTFGHIVETCLAIDRSERPDSALNIPNLCRLGLGHAAAGRRGGGAAGGRGDGKSVLKLRDGFVVTAHLAQRLGQVYDERLPTMRHRFRCKIQRALEVLDRTHVFALAIKQDAVLVEEERVGAANLKRLAEKLTRQAQIIRALVLHADGHHGNMRARE